MLEFDLVKKHGHYCVKVVIYESERLFVVDTGWSHSIVAKRIVRPAELGKEVLFTNIGRKRHEAFLKARIGDYRFPFTFYTEDKLTGKGNADFDGILGDNFLKLFSLVAMNPNTNKLRLYTDSTFEDGIKVTRSWDRMCVKVNILNQEGYLIIDTGFNGAIVCYGSLYHSLKKKCRFLQRINFFALELKQVPLDVFQVPGIQLGNITINAPVGATSLKSDRGYIDNLPVLGVIGLEVLMNHGFALCYSTKRLKLGTIS